MAIEDLEALGRRLDLQGYGESAESDADCPFRWLFHFLNSLAPYANELCGVAGVLSGEHYASRQGCRRLKHCSPSQGNEQVP